MGCTNRRVSNSIPHLARNRDSHSPFASQHRIDLSFLTEAIANHLIHQLGREKIGMCLSCHRTKFDYIHTNDSSTEADLAEKVEQLIPMQPPRFRRSHCGHFTGIERIQIDSDISMLAQAFPRNNGMVSCQLVAPDYSYIWLCLHEFSFFGAKTAHTNLGQRYTHFDYSSLNRGMRERRTFKYIAQIAVSIDVDNSQVGKILFHCGNRGGRERVLTTDRKGELPTL